MMYFAALFLISAVALSNAEIVPLQGTLDVQRLQTILQDGLKSKDASTLYYALKGLTQLKAKIPDVCSTIKSLKYNEDSSAETVFYISNAAALSGCLNSLSPGVMAPATQALDKKDTTIQELYYAVYTLKALGKGATMNKDEALKNLVQLLKKDGSPPNYGYVFALCLHIGCEQWTVSHAEGVLVSADESDGRALHWEGGLPATAMLLSTIVSSHKALKLPSPLSEAQRYKFAEYVLSRRAVSTPRGAALLLEAATAIADDEPTPIAVVIKGKKYITMDSDSIEVSVTDLLGRPIKSLKADDVIAQSGTRLADDVVVLSKQPLTQKSGEPTTFVLNLSKLKSQYGTYKLSLSAVGKALSLTVSVLGEIRVSTVEIGVGDVDGTTSPRVTTVSYPGQLPAPLQADHMQKVSLKFTVRDQANRPVTVQQAFVRVAAGDDEAIFVAEPDSTKAYKVDLNVAALGKLLHHQSGSHSLTIYLGDSAAASPIEWPLGTVSFSFGNALASPRSPPSPRGPLPEISHQFRQPEPRPVRLLSDLFAAACAAPLLLLLALWAKLRVNLSGMPLAPSALVFHLSLGASLALYGVFWLQLSMFETARYLAPLGLLTFLSGHRLLRTLAADKKQR